ncbi:MAG: SCP2 sterol-binding domain-containing protein [Candidatus Binatia bacterium]
MDETAKKKLRAKIMLQAMMFGVQEIAREDPGIQAQLKGWDRVLQYSVHPDGPHLHFVAKDGTITAVHGKNESASATILFADLDTALAIFSRKLDPQAAFMQGKVKLTGDMADAMKITMITQLAQPYFS